ncbi:MAG TPA: hypothetical protein VF434_03025 [Promineifilum sp.]
MNLLLQAEARQALARLRGEPAVTGLPELWYGSRAPILPDSLFAELGYSGALADQTVQLPIHDRELHDMLQRMLERSLSVV